MTAAAMMERYRAAVAALPPSETYVGPSRGSVIGYVGTTAAGRVCTFRCVVCSDASPLRGDHGRPAPERFYGEDHREFARLFDEQASRGGADWYLGEACDSCRATTLDLSMRCHAEHDAQQARWSRGPVLALVEYGIPAGVRCRVY